MLSEWVGLQTDTVWLLRTTHFSYRIRGEVNIVMLLISSRKVSLIRYILMLTLVALCYGCDERYKYDMQADVDDLGDAMAHCRGYTKFLVPDDALITLDGWSSRETSEYYDVFFELTDSKQNGYAKCRVNKAGLITYHGIRDFQRKARSFAGF